MTPHFSQRALQLQPSATLQLARRSAEMRARGLDVLSFGLGEPDFDTPRRAREAAIAAIHRGETHYTANEGILPLRAAIANWLRDDQGVRFDPEDEILVTAGAKQAVAQALLALVDPGDDVLLPKPYWVTYPELIRFCGGRAVFVETRSEDGFHLRAADLEKAVTERCRVLVLNSPNNPTGAVLKRAELEAIADVVIAHDLIVVSDEIYGPLVYRGDKHVSIATVRPEMRDRTVVCHGMSKAFAMTGWRLGFAAARREIIEAMNRIQSHFTSNASSIAQHAALEAVTHCLNDIPPMRDEFDRRRKLVIARMGAIPGLVLQEPEGAFYAFPTIRDLLGRKSPRGVTIDGSVAFCDALLEEGLVSVIPGDSFGRDDAFRLSYAASYAKLEEGLARIAAFVESLR
jgi:aspartate aminotransferase